MMIDMPEIQSSSHLRKAYVAISAVAFLLLLSFGVAYFYISELKKMSPANGSVASGANRLSALVPTDLIEARRSGDFDAAVRNLEELESMKPEMNATQQGLVVINSLSVKFNATGDTGYILEDIRNLKNTVLNGETDSWVRIRALNALSSAYCRSGRDPLAFEEIYKDEPFRQYFVEGDPDLSARKMAEWSYATRATSFAAARISRWYSEQALENTSLAAHVRADYVEQTKEWVAKADRLAVRELEKDPNFERSMQYATYKFWRTVAVARLAALGDVEHRQTYRNEFENLFSFLKGQQNSGSLEFEFLGRHFYAQLLVRIDGDVAAAEQQADSLAMLIRSLNDPNVMTYVRFLRNEKQHRSADYIWKNTQALMKLSPAYNAAVNSVL